MDLQGFTEELRMLCLELLPRFVGSAHQKMETKVKEDSTPVTSLDDYAMERFRTLISAKFPDHFTIGEEDKRNEEEMRQILGRPDQYQWSIDGLDGTWHFDAGTNSYGAGVALRYGNYILFTMYFRPIDMALRGNGFFYAEKGKGAWEWCGCKECGGKYHRLYAAPYNPKRRLVVMLEGSSKKFWTTAVRFVGAAETTRPSLSSCIAATTLARGNAEPRVIVTSGHKPWDGWPLALMVQEAGGIVTDHRGSPYSAEDCSNLIAAANGTDHAHVLMLLNKAEA